MVAVDEGAGLGFVEDELGVLLGALLDGFLVVCCEVVFGFLETVL